MPYAPTDWVDGVTPVNAANLDHLEAGVANAVEKPAGIQDGETALWDAGTSAWVRSTTTGESLKLAGAGILFGGDTFLTRSAGNILRTEGAFVAGAGALRLSSIGPGGGGHLEFGISSTYDTTLYRSAADVLKTDDRLVVAQDLVVEGGIGTSLPASPVNGQEFTLVDSLTVPTYAWHLRYIAAASKWFYIGGAPLAAAVATLENTASTTYTDLATAGPSVIAPRAGDYRVAIGTTPNNLTGGQSADMSFAIGATAAVDADRVRHTSSVAGAATSAYREMVKNLAVGTTLTMKYKATGGTAYFSDRAISIYPIWLT